MRAEEPACDADTTRLNPAQKAIQLRTEETSYANPYNPYETMKVPTQITEQGGWYFICDCYHNQVLYARQPGIPLKEWKVMTADVEQPHAIAGDGQVYLVTDTENDRIQVFEWKYGRFQNTQRIENVGERPHYIVYDESTRQFYIWSSLTGEMYIVERDIDSTEVYLTEVRKIEELDGFYVRSFTICEDMILFPSGNHCYITLADKETLTVLARYPVPPEISGMAYILPIGNYFYITVSSDLQYNQRHATVLRTTDLNSLQYGVYEDLRMELPIGGIPYYIDRIHGQYYITNGEAKQGIWKFGVERNMITEVSVVQ